MALAQIRTNYPDISPDVRTCAHHYPCPSDPSGSVRSSIYIIGNRLAFCPTVLQRQQERAAAEKEKAAAEKEKAAAEKQKMDAEEAEATFQKKIPLLLAKRKEIGDTVCDQIGRAHV